MSKSLVTTLACATLFATTALGHWGGGGGGGGFGGGGDFGGMFGGSGFRGFLPFLQNASSEARQAYFEIFQNAQNETKAQIEQRKDQWASDQSADVQVRYLFTTKVHLMLFN